MIFYKRMDFKILMKFSKNTKKAKYCVVKYLYNFKSEYLRI